MDVHCTVSGSKYTLYLARQIGQGKPLMKSRDVYLSEEEHLLAVSCFELNK